MSDSEARTDFLFPTSTYASGAASVIDIGGTLVALNQGRFPEEADAHAMWADWNLVGNDLAEAAPRIAAKRPK